MNQVRIFNGLLCACVIASGMAGCADRATNRCAVLGEVKFKGKPLDQGTILFLSEDPTRGSAEAIMIKDGLYSRPAKDGLLPGRYKVSIGSVDSKNRVVDPDSPPGYLPVPKDRIQPKYNTQTILSAEVKTEGPNTFNFEVN